MRSAVLGLFADKRWQIGALVATLIFAFLRLAHVRLLWADEDYHLTSALFLLNGKIPYRDYWYDKPPLTALYYLLIGAHSGWLLRLLDGLFVLAACFVAFRFARAWWGEREGWIAALLLAFFTAFYYPSAVVSFAPDALMLLPHLAALYSAYESEFFQAGMWCGVAFLANAKALLVLAACAFWLMPVQAISVAALLCGFVVPVSLGALLAVAVGAWPGYVQQVWQWGLIYARESPATHPLVLGMERTANWAGFHAALVLGATACLLRSSRRDRFSLVTWTAISFVGVCLGTRFFPRYFLQFLPPLILASSRGIVLLTERFKRTAILATAILLCIPAVRFGSWTARLFWDDLIGREPKWSDAALDLDSQHVARVILPLAHPADTLFVWGYRSDVYVYTRMISDGLFWDSQPLTGVLADRHLFASAVTYAGPAASNRREFVKSRPTFFVDGLGVLNPKLRPDVYPEVASWLRSYKLVGRTALSLVYKRGE